MSAHLHLVPPAKQHTVTAINEVTRLRRSVADLESALSTSRVIGIAVGILVERGRLTPEDAVELLATVSQHEDRKLRDVAADFAYSGQGPEAS